MRLKITIVAVTAATLLSGCAQTAVNLDGNAPPPPGNPSVGVAYSGAAAVAAVTAVTVGAYAGLTMFGYLIAGMHDGADRMNGGYSRPYWGPPPEMDPKRVVTEQDCTRPAVPNGGNLRCR